MTKKFQNRKKPLQNAQKSKKPKILKLLKTPSNMIFWCFWAMLWSFPMVFGRNSLVYDRFSLFLGSKTSKVTLGYAKGSKKGSSEKNEKGWGKSKKMKFFKTVQNATKYDFLVFLDHFMVIFYGFR